MMTVVSSCARSSSASSQPSSALSQAGLPDEFHKNYDDTGVRKVYVETSRAWSEQQRKGGQAVTFGAQHWIVTVAPGKMYQSGSDVNGKNMADIQQFRNSGVGHTEAGLTSKTDAEIDAWVKKWNSDATDYNLITNSCQTFACALVHYLCNGAGKLPASGGVQYQNNSAGFNAKISLGEVASLAAGPGKAAVSAFNVGVQATNTCAFVKGELFKAELGADTRVGRFSFHVSPNSNTGAGIRDGNLEATLFGFGAKVGRDGIGVHTSLAGANCSIM